jgi:hypothetical protein
MDFDDLLRLVAGLTAANVVDTAQRDRILGIALEGVCAAR